MIPFLAVALLVASAVAAQSPARIDSALKEAYEKYKDIKDGKNADSPPANFILGSMGILASGIAGGYVAGWVGGRKPIAHAISVLIFLTIDSTTVLFFRKRHDPLWFGLMTALGLMAATVVGGYVRAFQASRAGQQRQQTARA